MNESKFDGKGQVYAQFRPAYAIAFMDNRNAEVSIDAGSVIADVGSGTGIFTRQLLERGNKVYAVEPNHDMRVVAETDLSGFGGFVSIEGSAESTMLADGSVDCITVAQAFHWFDRNRFKTECRRILKPGGRVILVWNSRDESSELIRENEAINRKYCPDFKGFSGGMRFTGDNEEIEDFFDGRFEARVFPNDLVFDEQEFIGRNLSGSYALKENDRDYGAYVAAIKVLFEKYGDSGLLTMPNLTRSFVGTV